MNDQPIFIEGVSPTARPTLDEAPIWELGWDEYVLANAHAQALLASGWCATESDAFEAALADEMSLRVAFEDFLEDFTVILKDLSPQGYFHVEGRDMGWRRLSGTLGLQATDARAFIARAFPHTSEWTLQGAYHPAEATLRYRLSHHDAPTGERYTVRQGILCPATGEILRAPPAAAEGGRS
jgi:hypothetical protein